MVVRRHVYVVCDICERPAVDEEVDCRTPNKARDLARKLGYVEAVRGRGKIDICPACVSQPPARADATVGHVTPTELRRIP